jgi:hypothetical protein
LHQPLTRLIHAVDVKYVFAQVDANYANLVHGLLRFAIECRNPIVTDPVDQGTERTIPLAETFLLIKAGGSLT